MILAATWLAGLIASSAGDSVDPSSLSVAGPAPSWIAQEPIWFFYRRADLAVSQAQKLGEIARLAAAHPTADVCINRPSDTSNVEPDTTAINEQRVFAIRDALLQAGVAAARIHIGAFGAPTTIVDRQVVVFIGHIR